MTNDQINAAIAKALGWRVEDGVYMWTEHGIDKETQAEDYEELLGEYGFHSTARQRAEAFLMTLGKWKEVQP